MIFRCCKPLRRNAVAAHATLNGIDFLQVLDRDLPTAHAFRQRTLFLHCLKPVGALDRDNLRLSGGERIRNLQIEWAAPGVPAPAQLTVEEAALLADAPDPDRVLVVRTDAYGDRSDYVLRLVRSPQDEEPPANFDPQLVEVTFSFKVDCPSEFDCKPERSCPDEAPTPPGINYLAKDYASFRRLLLDRLSRLLPDFRNRSPVDTGVALAELLSYVGDQLSYRQDAAATEAYLGTARSRVSLRRHAVLVDYRLFDGCNARAFVHVETNAVLATLSTADLQLLTRTTISDRRIAPGSSLAQRALAQHPEVFQPIPGPDVVLRLAHNAIDLYAWGDRDCCLPRGSTRATLRGHLDALMPGDLLLFEALRGPTTHRSEDADPGHRHVVRLTSVSAFDAADTPRIDPLHNVQVTEIGWADADALPFALCLSSVADDANGGGYRDDLAIARGNIIVVDHGRSVTDEDLGMVPEVRQLRAPAETIASCQQARTIELPARYRPALAQGPLTQVGYVWRMRRVAGETRRERVRVDETAPAAAAMRWSRDDVLPDLVLDGDGVRWTARRDLLSSGATAPDVVAEVDDDDRTILRFGDDVNARRPDAGTAFLASYRVGNGSAGNVGAEAIFHVVSSEPSIVQVRNPLPAHGGLDPETPDELRRRAPEAFRRQERAVTTDDYAEVTTRHAGVQNAAASLRWTGSWHTVFVTVDREGGAAVDAGMRESLGTHLDRFRMAGQDTALRDPIPVPLELALHVCVRADHFRSDVRRALGELFSARRLRDGRLALFHPDRLGFGQPVYLSPLYAAAHAVPGVQSVRITAFRRQGAKETLSLKDGRIVLGPLEIARLDNDPNFPERGVLQLDLHGGK